MEGNIIKEIISILNDNLGLLLALLVTIGGIIERSKSIALKPISAFFKWVGRISNKELVDKVVEVNTRTINLENYVVQIDNKVDNNERDRIRHEILYFSNSLRDGQKHSKDEFQHIQEIYYKYNEVLMGNGLITEEYEYIKSVYTSIFNRPLQTMYTER